MAALARIYIPAHASVTKEGKPTRVKAHWRNIADSSVTPKIATKKALPKTAKVTKEAVQKDVPKENPDYPGISDKDRARAEKIDEILKGTKTTQEMYATTGPDGREVYTPERRAQQQALIADMLDRVRDVPNERKSIISGGLGGSGKTTILTRHTGVDLSQYVTLNPDDVKEEMIARGMAPEVEGLKPRETAALLHEESSMITKAIAREVYAEGKNVIWDITMNDRDKVFGRLTDLRGAGYSVRAVYVDVPSSVAKARALARWLRGDQKDELGGRYVSPKLIGSAETPTGNRNLDNFRMLAADRAFDEWELWDNTTTARRISASLKETA